PLVTVTPLFPTQRAPRSTLFPYTTLFRSDVVVVNGFTSHLELMWELEQPAKFYEGLASFARVINFDRRGTGLSDPVNDAPTLEQDRKSTRLNSSHQIISYAVFCLKKKNTQ